VKKLKKISPAFTVISKGALRLEFRYGISGHSARKSSL